MIHASEDTAECGEGRVAMNMLVSVIVKAVSPPELCWLVGSCFFTVACAFVVMLLVRILLAQNIALGRGIESKIVFCLGRRIGQGRA